MLALILIGLGYALQRNFRGVMYANGSDAVVSKAMLAL